MRPLVIVCEEKDVSDLNHAIDQFVHPAMRHTFVSLVVVDLNAHSLVSEKFKVTDACRLVPSGSTNSIQVCGTKEVGATLNLSLLLSPYNIDFHAHARSKLCATHRTPALMQQLLSSCGLTVKSAAAEMFSGWAHQQIDARSIEAWAAQFNRLGKLSWLSQAILGSVRFVSQAQLGDLLCAAPIAVGHALSVNHDSRTHGKSGDVIANLIVKRMQGAQVFENPADAAERGHRKITIFEDGLFTGTETVGVLESLLGERQPERLKTKPLKDPSIFPQIEFMLNYGVGTDYGQSLVNRFLKERNFDNVTVRCANLISITKPGLLAEIDSGRLGAQTLWKFGPPDAEIEPNFLTIAEATGRLTTEQLSEAHLFCSQVGRQLFYNYTQEMKTRRPGFQDWESTKLDKCSLGMWGQGLTLTFGHSIPKASLPLLWGTGPVNYAGKHVNSWLPLFPNSW